MVSATLYLHFSMFDLQRPIPVLSLFKHFQCNHVALDPGPRSSDGMDLRLYGTDRRWWVHALSRSTVFFIKWCDRVLFLTSCVCLQAGYCIGNA